jgi:hypothetical protein
LHSFVLLYETNILSLINQCLDNYYQIKTKLLQCSTVNRAAPIRHLNEAQILHPRAHLSARVYDLRSIGRRRRYTSRASEENSSSCSRAAHDPISSRSHLHRAPSPHGVALRPREVVGRPVLLRRREVVATCSGVARREASRGRRSPRPAPASRGHMSPRPAPSSVVKIRYLVLHLPLPVIQVCLYVLHVCTDPSCLLVYRGTHPYSDSSCY